VGDALPTPVAKTTWPRAPTSARDGLGTQAGKSQEPPDSALGQEERRFAHLLEAPVALDEALGLI
jgi:hypothetical protein